jgi:hypothetical protein
VNIVAIMESKGLSKTWNYLEVVRGMLHVTLEWPNLTQVLIPKSQLKRLKNHHPLKCLPAESIFCLLGLIQGE